jgi:iron complex outermembrane receptor protein
MATLKYYIEFRATQLLFATSLIVLSSTASVMAQDDATKIDEITVTAQRRQVDIQDAALAVSVLSGEDFDKSNITRLDNFNGYVPSLTIAKNDGAGRVVSIRGVGWETAQNLSTQPSVLMYVDGVYMANPLSMGTDLGDLERIEVFRGPQGTEFGQGTTGGAINLVTIKPSFDALSGNVELTAGTYNLVRARGAINVPLSDNAAIRASVQSYRHDGFSAVKGGIIDGYELDDAESLTGKFSLLWEPGESWSVYLSAFLQDSDQNAAAQRNVDEPLSGVRDLSQDFPGKFELDNDTYSAIIEWELAPGVVMKSITGYQELRKKQTVDGDRMNEVLTSIDILGFVVTTANWDVLTFWDNDSDAFSQEFNLSYAGESVDWVAGGYYLDHENFNHFLEANGPSPFSDSIPALMDPGPDTLPPFQSVLNFVEARTVSREDWAAYGQVRFRPTDRFSILLGGRYQSERQLDEALQFFFIPSSQRTDDTNFTWKVGLDFHATDNNLLYGLISTGWKNGGTNPGALNGAIDVPVAFKPAEVISYEIGSKNTFADDRVRLNVAAFLYDYDNLQFMQEDPVPFAGGTGNIPSTDVYGIETEFTWLLSEAWQLDGHVTWLDGDFNDDFTTLDVVDFREGLAPGVGLFTPAGFDLRLALSQSTNLKGNTPPKLVDLTARLALINKHNFSNNAVLSSRLEFIHRGEFQARVFNNSLVDTVPSYNIVNLLFNYQLANERFNLGVGATNLFEENGVNGRFSNPFGLLSTSEEYIPPQEVFVGIRYDF